MSGERQSQVRQQLAALFESAVAQPEGSQRDAWINKACGGDPSLESQLREMLSANDTGSWAPGAPAGPEDDAPPPSTVGPFRMEGEIGRGGMGVVYRAIDTRLDRPVAIKALPTTMARDPRRLARFEQEAKTLAALNHPNVAAIYGLEKHESRQYLILEYVGGATLDERLYEGPMPVDEVVTICAQIAAGVSAAHDTGIIHRDLKPANIKITPEGEVKVLDFGLAKAHGLEGAGSGAGGPSAHGGGASPLQTMEGAIIGTAAYMSPEQARGRELDQRTDIWSFGVILYECLTGTSHFRTPSAAESIEAILHKPISFESLPGATSPVLRHVLQRCLERDRKRRLRDLHDVRIALETDSSTADMTFAGRGPGDRRWRRRAIGAALAIAIGALAIGFFSARGLTPRIEPPPRRLSQLFAPAEFVDTNPDVDIASHGGFVVYRGTDGRPDDPPALYVRQLDVIEATRLPYSDHAAEFALSPDDTRIAYFWEDPTSDRIQLRVLDLAGGEPLTVLTDTGGKWFPIPVGRRPAWFSTTELGLISNAMDRGPVVYRVPVNLAAGINDDYELERFAEFERPNGSRYGYHLTHVRGRDYMLFTLADHSAQHWYYTVCRLDRDGFHKLVENATRPIVTPDGHLFVVRGGSILAARFDLEAGVLLSEPVPFYTEPESKNFDLSDDGTLVMARNFGSDDERRIVTIRPSGEGAELLDTTANYVRVLAVSADGGRVVVSVREPGIDNSRLRVIDVATGVSHSVPTAPDGAGSSSASWLPDGRLCFATWNGPGKGALYVVDPSLTTIERLMGGDGAVGLPQPPEVTPDGVHAVFGYMTGSRDGANGIYVAELEGMREPRPLITGAPFPPAGPALSPDGNWIAYTQLPNVSVRRFSLDPETLGEPLVIPNVRGPTWFNDGKELLCLQQETSSVMSVRVTTEPELTLSSPRKILDFDALDAAGRPGQLSIATMPDGRLVYVGAPKGGFDPHLHIVLNADAELERRLADSGDAVR